jgi:hemerythrin
MTSSHDHYILGLPEMDEQHNYLYCLFDRIEPSQQVTSKTGTKALLEEIERYLLFHFSSEEQLMRTYGFPGFATHQSDHDSAGDKFVQFTDDFEANRLNPGALKIFLTGWLMEHSRISDSEYVEWVKERRECVNA